MSKSFTDKLLPSTLSKNFLCDIAQVIDSLESGHTDESLNTLLKIENDMKALIVMEERDKDKLIFCNIKNDKGYLK